MIIPAIDLIDGQVVRLFKGDYQQQTDYKIDPLEQLTHYQEQGAQLLHLVDLTGAKDPTKRQTKLIKHIASHIHVKLQVGGGIREKTQVSELLDAGVARVVIGSLAIKQPEIVIELINDYGAERICLALDIKISEKGEKLVASAGWQQTSGDSLERITDHFLNAGLKHALVTDISRDGTLTGSNAELYQELAQQYPQIAWQASGGIASLEHVSRIKKTGASGIIIGKALLEQHFNVKEAIACWQNA